jgi:hypothetical protein
MTERQEEKQVEVFPPPEEEPPEPTFRQYFVGWGVIFLGLIALGVLLGVLMRVLR